MRFSITGAALWAASMYICGVGGVASTDSYMDADLTQSGYLPNHNMDPAIVDSAQFGILWKQAYKGEQFYAKPLVFTPAGQSQLVFLASTQNWIRTVNAKNGTLINSRQVHTPFLQTDLNGCGDIANYIGIVGTPVIDPQTEIAYFFSKTYIPDYRTPGATGLKNGVYYFHGVDVKTLQDVPGFPVLIDGSIAQNDPLQYFIGGVILQRPSLLKVGNTVYGGFGGHCDKFNYTGAVIGVDVVQKQVNTYFAMESGPLIKHSAADFTANGGGGEAGVWQSGFGFSTDGNRLFVVTGNGKGNENNGVPASGRSGLRTLGEAVVNLGIADNGTLYSQDYFQPYDYINLDGGDQDFGSSGLCLLDPTVFKGTGVNRIGVTAGKNGKIYFVNADNLGGYKMGQGQTDNVVWSIATDKAVFGGAGSYPLEGGYVYITPNGYPTYVYQMVLDSAGKPQFVQTAQSNETSAGRVGVGVPTVTSMNGKAGTAIVWMTDPDAGIRAWYAVPGSNGYLKSIKLPQIGGVVKFQRPAFGDTRLYTSDSNGNVYCLGSPVNLPLNCSTPVDFGDVALGSSSRRTVNCTALIAITNIAGATVLDSNWQVDNATLPKGAVAKGASFSFPVVWNLTKSTVSNTANSSYGLVTPGIKSTPLTLYTTNGVGGYANSVPLSLIGNQVSQKPFLITAPPTVDFGGLVRRGTTNPDPKSLSWTIKNAGLTNMTILGYAWTTDGVDDDDGDDDGPDFTNATYNDGVWNMGDSFTSTNLPPVGTVLLPGKDVAVQIDFSPEDVGSYLSYFNTWTDGGHTNTILEGSESTAPIANMSISTGEGGWLDVTKTSTPEMPYGSVLAGTSTNRTIRICNNGGSVLKISKSKPPNGVFYITSDAVLHEEQEIPIGECAYGTVIMGTVAERYNQVDEYVENYWTLNTDDLTFGVHVVHMSGTIVSKKTGPTNSTGNPVYTYLGCFNDNVNGRLLNHQLYNGANNTNGNCQALCTPGGYIFAGTEYKSECYCGSSPPPTAQQVDDTYCSYPCSGDGLDHCGGPYNSGGISIFYDATRYTPGANSTYKPGGLPIDQQVGNYSYVGCYTEGTGGKALNGSVPGSVPANGTTVQNCMSRCASYSYFGVEYANQCYCGNAISNNASLQASNNPDINGCNMFCKGNSSQYCGGSSRLNVYYKAPIISTTTRTTTTASISTSSAVSSTSKVVTTTTISTSSAASTSILTSSSSSSTSAASSTASTSSSGSSSVSSSSVVSTIATTTAFTSTSTTSSVSSTVSTSTSSSVSSATSTSTSVATSSTSSSSSSATPTPTSSTVVTTSSSSVATTTTTSSTISTTSTTAAATPTGPVIPQNISGIWSYQGCYTEATGTRALGDLVNPISSANVSNDACAKACSNYTYSGTEFGSECYCGYYLRTGSALASGGSDPAKNGCSSLCKANSTQYCGGSSRLSLYKSNVTAPVTNVTTLTNWTYAGCYKDNVSGRALATKNNLASVNVSVENCAKACQGSAYFGVEYGSECYCGNAIGGNSTLVTGNNPGETGCGTVCKGNTTEYCGGSSRLNLYQFKNQTSAKSKRGFFGGWDEVI